MEYPLTQDDIEAEIDPDLENLCRKFCQVEGIDPDKMAVGFGIRVEVGVKYPLWKIKLPLGIIAMTGG